ncbi:glycosyltransferase family 2 protein [Xanthobacter autotrophicus DSM 431]|uniref:glycosyltransferase family 2 protein n=1 Tax=Xanthobacter nonsaccharivorans TaxID=3119912 RepID=UPI00372CAC7C
MGKRIALVIPTLNEASTIGGTLAELPAGVVDLVVVADGGSTDGTREIAAAAGATVLASGRGFGRACLEGVCEARDADIIAFMDADGADDPAFLPALLKPVADGAADFAVASRTRGVREPGAMAWHQILAGQAAGLGMRALYGVPFSDMCTFRAIRRDALVGLGMRELTYGWNIEMQMRAARAGLSIVEIPVAYRCRRGGVSKVAGNLGTSLTAGARIVSTFLRVAMQVSTPAAAPNKM